MTTRNVTNPQTHLKAEYPKFVDGVLYLSEDDEMEADNQEEKDRMVKELEEMGKSVDLRSYKGAAGFVTLKLYYEGVISRGNDDGNRSNDS